MTPPKGTNSKTGGHAKAGAAQDEDAENEHGEDKQTPTSGASTGDGNDGDEAYGEGEAFDDEDKAEGNGGRERRKIEIKFIQNKARRHITFSKRKHGIMKKAWELSVLTGTQVLLLVVSETGLVYTFTTPKLQPLVTQNEGKNLIQACLNAPESSTDGNDDSPEPEQGAGSESEVSPPSSAPSDAAPDRLRTNGRPSGGFSGMRESQEAQGPLTAQNGSHLATATSPPVASNSQEALSPQPAGHAAAVRAAMQAQAQTIAVSGFPPQLQQFAAQGYKVPPGNAQYAAYQGYPFSMNGQYGQQIPNMSQMNGQFPNGAPIDTATLMAMQQQEGMPAPNGEYPPMYTQGPPPHSQGQGKN